MTHQLFDEPAFWGFVALALFAGFLAGFLLAALLRGNEEGSRS